MEKYGGQEEEMARGWETSGGVTPRFGEISGILETVASDEGASDPGAHERSAGAGHRDSKAPPPARPTAL